MTLTRLGSLALHLSPKSLFLQRLTGNGSKALVTFRRNRSTVSPKKDDEDELDKPIKFLNSEAAKWDAVASRRGRVERSDIPWFQDYVILGSVTVFMIYFCILREENDIDEKLSWELSDHFEGEKKENLLKSQQIYRDLVQQGYPQR